MTTEQTTFHRTVVSQLEDELMDLGNQPMAAAVYELASNVNRCDETLRSSARTIRDRLAEMERNLDGGFNVYQIHLSQPSQEMAEAVAKREVAITTLVVLLGQERFKKLLDDSKARFASKKAGQ